MAHNFATMLKKKERFFSPQTFQVYGIVLKEFGP